MASVRHPAFRPEARSGVWCCFALPAALWAAQDGEPVRKASAIVAFLSAAAIVFAARDIFVELEDVGRNGSFKSILHAIISDLFEREASRKVRLERREKERKDSNDNDSPLNRKKSLSVNWSILAAFCLVLAIVNGTILHLSIAHNLLACCSFTAIVKALPPAIASFPLSFTLGEAVMMLQAIFVFIFEASVVFMLDSDDPTTKEGSINIIAKCGVLSCIVVCFLPLMPLCSCLAAPHRFLAFALSTLTGISLPFLWITLKRNPVAWVISYSVESKQRILLLVLWASCSVCCFLVVKYVVTTKQTSSTRTRKYFHFLAVIVHTTGILLDSDPYFLYLASVVILCVMCMLEAMRYYRVPVVAPFLDAHLKVFLSEHEKEAALIPCHIYTLVGCSAPLWLAMSFSAKAQSAMPLKLLSGVLSTGIGDSAASIVGSLVGRIKYPDSKKSVEGTMACAVAQFSFIRALELFGLVVVGDWNAIALPIVIVSMVEALTTQTDNAVLSLVLYVLL